MSVNTKKGKRVKYKVTTTSGNELKIMASSLQSLREVLKEWNVQVSTIKPIE